MSTSVENYANSNPNEQAQEMSSYINNDITCFQCRLRTPKWYYPYLEKEYLERFRCVLHPMSPAPGPDNTPLFRRVAQLY